MVVLRGFLTTRSGGGRSFNSRCSFRRWKVIIYFASILFCYISRVYRCQKLILSAVIGVWNWTNFDDAIGFCVVVVVVVSLLAWCIYDNWTDLQFCCCNGRFYTNFFFLLFVFFRLTTFLCKCWNGHLQSCRRRSRWNKDFQVWIGST
jgi:hypothetical protein